jgi:hypothetical protein
MNNPVHLHRTRDSQLLASDHSIFHLQYHTHNQRGHFAYPTTLPDGPTFLLPVRQLLNKRELLHTATSLNHQPGLPPVTETLGTMPASLITPYAPSVLVALPTLDLSLALAVSRALGHRRYVLLASMLVSKPRWKSWAGFKRDVIRARRREEFR